MAAKKEVKFDEALQQLEGIIRQLESGNLPLEEAIDLYKEGMTLSTECHQKLQKIEAEVVKLVDASGNVSAFDEGGE
ncbi:MAG: exodeoxyribonuclease VII small subunit [Defluviitaleaceae bacterium]|nr:exodeoxyribonuclease VII small subunit [Defluviitaleaceae bacterium]